MFLRTYNLKDTIMFHNFSGSSRLAFLHEHGFMLLGEVACSERMVDLILGKLT